MPTNIPAVKSNGLFKIVIAIVVILLVGVAGYYLYKNASGSKNVSKSGKPLTAEQRIDLKKPDSNWKSYAMANGKLTVKAPQDFELVGSSEIADKDNIILVKSDAQTKNTVIIDIFRFNEAESKAKGFLEAQQGLILSDELLKKHLTDQKVEYTEGTLKFSGVSANTYYTGELARADVKMPYYAITVTRPDGFYMFNMSVTSKEMATSYKAVLEKIVGSTKFGK